MESPTTERELFPPAVIKLWNQWQLRCLVLLSFTLQATLTILGNRRNYTTKIALRIIIWLSYLFADAVAGLALGIFSQNNPEDNSIVLVLWIPLLLLHLGGPDFITAYALEDNELWLRHFLGLVIQVGGALYVFIKSWNTSSPVTYMAIPLFVAGLIKYGERTWALKSATSEEFIELARANADADEANLVELDLAADSSRPTTGKINLIATAYSFLQVAGTVLTDEKDNGMSQKCAYLVKRTSIKYVYDIIETELGLLYNWFYTKAQIFYSPVGFLLRFIGSCCLIAVTVAFTIIRRQSYDKIDVVISYLLLVGAILLETYSVFQLLLSDWMVILLYHFKKGGLKIVEAICRIKLSADGKHWSRKIGRFNLLDYALEKNPTWYYIPKKWDKHFYKSADELPFHLQVLIFKELADDSRRSVGKWSQEIEGKYGNEHLKWIFELSFSDSILIWHIATEMLYILDSDPTDPYREMNRLRSDPGREKSLEISKANRELSRQISEYMMYLLVVCPSMIPSGVQDFKISAACSLAKKQFNFSSTPGSKEFYASTLFRLFHNDVGDPNDHWDINDLWEYMDAEDQKGNRNIGKMRRYEEDEDESEDSGNGGQRQNSEEEDQTEDEEDQGDDSGNGGQSRNSEEEAQTEDEEDQSDDDVEDEEYQTEGFKIEDDAEYEDQQFDDQNGKWDLDDQNGEWDVEDQSHQKQKHLLERLSMMKNKLLICLSKEKRNARRTLRRKSTKISKREEMYNACKLADMFLSSSGGRNWTEQRRWKMIREVWLEMLFYAANQCKWEAHVQHLRRGGEFLTHVWMLMLLLGGNK